MISEVLSGYLSFLSVAVIKHSKQKQLGGGRGMRKGLFHLTLPGHHLSLKEVRQELKAGICLLFCNIILYQGIPHQEGTTETLEAGLPVDSCGFILGLLLYTHGARPPAYAVLPVLPPGDWALLHQGSPSQTCPLASLIQAVPYSRFSPPLTLSGVRLALKAN